jgi:hypothetical protein
MVTPLLLPSSTMPWRKFTLLEAEEDQYYRAQYKAEEKSIKNCGQVWLFIKILNAHLGSFDVEPKHAVLGTHSRVGSCLNSLTLLDKVDTVTGEVVDSVIHLIRSINFNHS